MLVVYYSSTLHFDSSTSHFSNAVMDNDDTDDMFIVHYDMDRRADVPVYYDCDEDGVAQFPSFHYSLTEHFWGDSKFPSPFELVVYEAGKEQPCYVAAVGCHASREPYCSFIDSDLDAFRGKVFFAMPVNGLYTYDGGEWRLTR